MSFNIQDFAAIWLQIYEHLHAIGHITLQTADSLPPFRDFPTCGPRVALAPHVDPGIDLDKCAELGLDERVVELLQAIPHPVSYEDAVSFSIFPRSKPNSFLDTETLELSRNPAQWYYTDPEIGSVTNLEIEKWEVPLTNPVPDGFVVLLDVRAGTIREISNDALPIETGESYHDSLAEPAMEKAQMYLNNLRNLDWLSLDPDAETGIIEKEAGPLHEELVKIIARDYGWPDNFRREDWKRERFRRFQEVMDAIS